MALALPALLPSLFSGALTVDVSYYQRVLDGSYDLDVFVCRHSDGDFIDPNFARNWAAARANPRIKVMVAYHVYRPSSDAVQVRRADRIRGDTAGVGCVMIDAETWGGQIKGNQSAGLNLLWGLLAARFGGNPRRVWGYANAGDFASMWPQRPALMPMVVASYSSRMPTWALAQMLMWQYTNGQYTGPGLRRSSSPFGACDHNVFPGFQSGAALAAWIGGAAPADAGGPAPTPTLSEEDEAMATIYVDKQTNQQFIIGPGYVHVLTPDERETYKNTDGTIFKAFDHGPLWTVISANVRPDGPAALKAAGFADAARL